MLPCSKSWDPEQNATFRDNYLNVDFDLSNALFNATANVYENIPRHFAIEWRPFRFLVTPTPIRFAIAKSTSSGARWIRTV